MSDSLILITGLPGTGKTTLGNYLEETHGFHHFDRESFGRWPRWQRSLWNRHIGWFIKLMQWWYGKLVITWGFSPERDIPVVKQLTTLGFTLFWFDGDRTIAHKHYTARGRGGQAEFFAQLKEVERLNVPELSATHLNPFAGAAFKSLPAQAAEIMARLNQ